MPSKKKTEPQEPLLTPVSEVDPIEIIKGLEEDMTIAVNGLRRILNIKPEGFTGGPSNKRWGRRHQQAFEKAQEEAKKTVEKLIERAEADG